MPTQKLSVVIVSWNNRKFVDFCLTSLTEQTVSPLEIIWVDNASSDDTVEYIRKNYPSVTLLPQDENLFFAKGNNVGIKRALKNSKCEYILTLNTDARLDTKWVEVITDFLDGHDDAACAQGLTLQDGDATKVDSRGIKLDKRGTPIQLGYNESRKNTYEIRQVFGVNAAAAAYTRTFLEKQPFGTEYFDEDFSMYLEDLDISARAVMLGYTNWFVPEAVAYHVGSASSGGNPKFMLYMTHRNLPLLLWNNFPLRMIVFALPHIFRAEVLRLLNLARGGHYHFGWAVIRGRVAGLALIPKSSLKRRKILDANRYDTNRTNELMMQS